MPEPRRNTFRLRIGRKSIPSAWYFLTAVCRNRISFFSDKKLRGKIITEIVTSDMVGFFPSGLMVVMPNHLHLVAKLGDTLTLSQSVGRLKYRIQEISLRTGCFQGNFFDHMVRHDENLESFARYVLLNPYRKSLITSDALWDGMVKWGNPPFQFIDEVVRRKGVPECWIGFPNPLLENQH